MFLIAGISPKTKIIDNTPRVCQACGLAQARLQRVDSYFNLFFIPLFRVRKGEPFVICNRCESITSELPPAYHASPPGRDSRCKACGRPLEEEFRYCPSCGQPVPKTGLLNR